MFRVTCKFRLCFYCSSTNDFIYTVNAITKRRKKPCVLVAEVSGFESRIAFFFGIMCEITFQIYHELCAEGKHCEGIYTACQFNGACEFPNLDWARVGTVVQALSYREETCTQQRDLYRVGMDHKIYFFMYILPFLPVRHLSISSNRKKENVYRLFIT